MINLNISKDLLISDRIRAEKLVSYCFEVFQLYWNQVTTADLENFENACKKLNCGRFSFTDFRKKINNIISGFYNGGNDDIRKSD